MTPPLTLAALEQAYAEIQARCFAYTEGTRSGPWIDHMDEALRRFELRHQFAIVGYGMGAAHGVKDASGWSPPERAAWLTLLESVNRRAEPPIPRRDVEIPGQFRALRPLGVAGRPIGPGRRRSR